MVHFILANWAGKSRAKQSRHKLLTQFAMTMYDKWATMNPSCPHIPNQRMMQLWPQIMPLAKSPNKALTTTSEKLPIGAVVRTLTTALKAAHRA